MKAHALLFGRGWLIVSLTALNVVNVTHRHWLAAFLTGAGISLVWRWNARNAVQLDTWAADLLYALGAAVGTLTGMGVGLWLAG